ncbi:MAG: DHA2 family efflux MFS transporter permease subunit [Alphaproteobacteria bacterium]|nr:DHA2 family efflux MFS transporter permease subunit [Alphaproteobacteria bacterium]MBU1563118.1 DHA2 family efflux MFS transporter permease subunit [Alphaproteobacteria bacterium]MBU2304312.1 DHA2 family efflux MFS transporter permease subunit [Alphaproteobacteria bacterium]MBU2368610.1 DHA2 family efflux MFS transporter permease subunit [Alphaproteobacteria bacterium]
MFVLLIANFMNLIDVTIVNVALPSMRDGLGATDSQIEWVVAAYILAFALGLLPFGRLGDILGRTRLFLWGVAGFTAASALCGLAPNIKFLIIARVIQGLAGAMMTPQVLAIATVTFPPHERGQAFSLFGLSAGLASVCGPILGGVLISANLFGMDWQPIFLVNIPIGIAAIIAGWFLIPRLPGHGALRNDYVGIGLFGLGILAVVFPIIEGRAYGWPLWAFAMMAAGLGLLVAFVLWTRRRAAIGAPQLLNFDLITNRQFMFGAFVITVFASGIPGMFMVISLLLQGGFAFTPLQSGLTNTPFSVGVLIASVIAGRFGARYLRARLATSGALLVIGIGWLHFYIAGVSDSIDSLAFLLPLLIAGIGLGLGFSSLFQLVLANVPPRDAGSGSGALQAFQQVGGALGVAFIGEIFFSNLGGAFATGASQHAAFAGASSLALWYVVGSFGLVLLMAPLFKRPGGHGPGRAVPVQPTLVEA